MMTAIDGGNMAHSVTLPRNANVAEPKATGGTLGLLFKLAVIAVLICVIAGMPDRVAWLAR